MRIYSVNQQEWDKSGLFLDNSGSGVLIDRQQLKPDPQAVYRYLVLTNNHVAKSEESTQSKECARFYIQTPDGLIHNGCRHKKAKFDKNDLALVWFYSPNRYEKAVPAKASSLKKGEKVFIAGFPCDLGSTTIPCPANFKFIAGEVALISKPLGDGYQIGYTNEVIEGTSGGPVLNEQGEVVGINGRGEGGANSTYRYADSSQPLPTQEEIKLMRQLRWGIPISIYLKLDAQKLFKEIPPLTISFREILYVSKDKYKANNIKSTTGDSNTDDITNTPPSKSLGSTPQDDNITKDKPLLNKIKILILYIGILIGGGTWLGLTLRKKLKGTNSYIELAKFIINDSPNPDSNNPVTIRFGDNSEAMIGINELGWKIYEINSLAIVINQKLPQQGKIYPIIVFFDTNYRFRNKGSYWGLERKVKSASNCVVVEFANDSQK